MQVEKIGRHDFPHLIEVYDGGEFEDRLYLLMNKAPGRELAKCLDLIPREKISIIVDQVAKACQFLRSRDLCHRDIKSANIFVSDDFSNCVLLDVSVVRDIHDPVGLGTDHGDSLPVVATSRYSPPEYLFRLIDPGPDLWHAVDIYQLGGLIHDLVMRSELFEKEYRLSTENRYRFAWLVATQMPELSAEDVDGGILLLGRRALDKDWERRSILQLSDFLFDDVNRGRVSLNAIGFDAGDAHSDEPHRGTLQDDRRIVGEISDYLHNVIMDFLKEKGLTTKHKVTSGTNDRQKYVEYTWNLPLSAGSIFNEISLQYTVSLINDGDVYDVCLSAKMTGIREEGRALCTHLDLPPIKKEGDWETVLYSNAVQVIQQLAKKLTELPLEEEG